MVDQKQQELPVVLLAVMAASQLVGLVVLQVRVEDDICLISNRNFGARVRKRYEGSHQIKRIM